MIRRIGAAIAISIAVAALHLVAPAAEAKDRVRLVDSQAQVFAHFGIYQAKAEGYYDAENLDVSIILGRGGADSLQAVVTGSQDIIFGTGILGVIAAYAKGAPVTIIGNAVRGANDVFWIVKADSPIKSLKDLDGKDLAYSAPGSLTHLAAQTMARDHGIKPKFIATGAGAASRTQMMSGQTQTAWASFPGGLEVVRSGEVRIISTADSPTLRNMTTRVVAANSAWLAKNRDVAIRMARAIAKGQDFNFSGGAAIARYAEHWKIDLNDAARAPDFYKIGDVAFAPIGDLERMIVLAKEYDFIKEPLSAEEVKKMVDIIYDPKRS